MNEFNIFEIINFLVPLNIKDKLKIVGSKNRKKEYHKILLRLYKNDIISVERYNMCLNIINAFYQNNVK